MTCQRKAWPSMITVYYTEVKEHWALIGEQNFRQANHGLHSNSRKKKLWREEKKHLVNITWKDEKKLVLLYWIFIAIQLSCGVTYVCMYYWPTDRPTVRPSVYLCFWNSSSCQFELRVKKFLFEKEKRKRTSREEEDRIGWIVQPVKLRSLDN